MDQLRLSTIERKALEVALQGLDGEAYVFGSRTSLESKGGDVDILVIPDAQNFSEYRLSQQIALAFQSVCEEKVDVVVLPRKMDEGQQAFYRTIKKVRVR